MSRAETSRLPILDALLEAGPEGASREELIQSSQTSAASFYRIIKPLLSSGIVLEKDWHYRLPLDHLYNYRYKLWRDAERLCELDNGTRSCVEAVLGQAKLELKDNLRALWLVGSAAHGTLTEESDLDFLAIVHRDQDFRPRVTREVQFIMETKASFQRKFHGADGFIASAIRYGLLLEDRGIAQCWLDSSMKIVLDDQLVEDTEVLLQEHFDKVLFHFRLKETQEVVRWLRAGVTTLGRTMLALYGHVPAGKPDLLGALSFYYGLFSEPLRYALEWKPSGSHDPIQLFKTLLNHWKRFQEVRRAPLTLTQGFLSLTASRFASQATVFFYVLLQDRIYEKKILEPQGSECCGRLIGPNQTTPGPLFRILFKSTQGPLREDTVEELGQRIAQEQEALVPILVVNPYNSVNPLKRSWGLSSEVQVKLKQYGILCFTAHQIMVDLNLFYLTGDRPKWGQTLASKAVLPRHDHGV